MISNYLKIAWRNLIKRKFYSAITVFGLAIAIASSMLLYLFISFHLSFDTYHKKAATTYRVVHELLLEETLHDKGASIAMYQALASGIPQVTDAAIMLNNYTFTVSAINDADAKTRFKEEENIALVSPGWFDLFDYHWIAGNPDDLKLPNTAAITQKQALKYFGNANPVGRTLIFENKQPVKIVGLINNKPGNSDLKADLFVSLSSLKNLSDDIYDTFYTDWAWLNSSSQLYISLTDRQAKDNVEATIARMVKTHIPENYKYYRFRLQPLSDVHFNTTYGASVQKSLLITLGIIGLLILLIASVNYVNISIAQQAKRSVEIGTRKVLGSSAGQLFMQFITETVLAASIAMLIAIGLVILFLPLANRVLFNDEPLAIISYQQTGLYAAALFVVLILLSGLYPAFSLSRINVFKALKNETASWKAGLIRKVLVVAQNSIAQVLIICTLIIVLQVRFMKNTDMGFNRNAVVMIPLPDADTALANKNYLSRKLAAIPQVQSLTFCYKAPSSKNKRGGSVHFDNRPD